MTPIREQVYAVGPGKSLVAIVTEPATATNSIGEPAIVILNTGIIHRVGHYRNYVVLARALAKKGRTVVRFDFSGIGDSDRRADNLPPLEGCMVDIRVVLDWLASTRQLKRYVLAGLCSGADHAVIYAGSDPRVAGVILLDPSIPPTPRYYMHYFSRRLVRLGSWRSLMTGRGRLATIVKKKLRLSGGSDRLETPNLDDRRVRDYLRSVYTRAVANKVRFLAVLTGTDSRQSYREQILDAFPGLALGPLLRAEFFWDCDHVFHFEYDRKRLNDIILDWIETTDFNDAQSAETVSPVHEAAPFVQSVTCFLAVVAT